MEKPNFRERMRSVSVSPGVYLMKDRLGCTIYVGKAKNLRKRLSSYFLPSRYTKSDIKTRALIDAIWDFEVQEVRNEAESLILESKLIKQYRPRYNVSLRDDKRFWLVKVQLSEDFPRFEMTRLRKEDGARYFGPFVHSSALKETIEWLNKEFGLRTCKQRKPGAEEYKHCHADIIRKCTAPCVGNISQQNYKIRVDQAVDFLDGKGKRQRFAHLREKMQQAADAMEFEKAAMLRDVLQNLEKTLSPARQFRRGNAVPSMVRPREDVKELGDVLGLSRPIQIMECFDISNVSSTHIVASMVRFVDGVPDNQSYRRYRIKSVAAQDDFASMAEVVRRRYKRIVLENRKAHAAEFEVNQNSLVEVLYGLREQGATTTPLPDLVIVDGGKGQLSSGYEELRALGLRDLPIVGLAKQFEEVFFPHQSESLRLDHASGALKLMQRIRDEAHRYANNYNELLLRKRMRESVLDDIPHMSEARKRALLRHFGSVAALKKADVEMLQQVNGVGTKTAEKIYQWFHSPS